ncbi:MAG: hypothetical protein ACRDJU_11740 [Actinomycetota bacterium]
MLSLPGHRGWVQLEQTYNHAPAGLDPVPVGRSVSNSHLPFWGGVADPERLA